MTFAEKLTPWLLPWMSERAGSWRRAVRNDHWWWLCNEMTCLSWRPGAATVSGSIDSNMTPWLELFKHLSAYVSALDGMLGEMVTSAPSFVLSVITADLTHDTPTTASRQRLSSKLYAQDDGQSGTFRWLGDTDDHGKWWAAYNFLLVFSGNDGSVLLGFRDNYTVLATSDGHFRAGGWIRHPAWDFLCSTVLTALNAPS